MSDFNESLGKFNPNVYKNNGTGNKPNQRMAGDYLTEFAKNNANDKKDEQKDFTYQGSNGKNYGTNTERMLFGNTPTSGKKEVSSQPVGAPTPAKGTSSKSSQSPSVPASGGFTLKPPKSGGKYYADDAEVKAAWNGVYDEDEYRYYVGSSGTGADAYHTDMAKYQAQMATMGDNPHMGLVNSMSHPDWEFHNYDGTYGERNKNANYSSPNNPKWQNQEQQHRKRASYGGKT